MTDELTRRAALSAIASLTVATTLHAAPATAADQVRLVAGTYAREGGKGLYPLAHDRASRRWRVESPVAGIDDASFAVRGDRAGLWYVLREQAAGSVTAFAGGWRPGATRSTGGADPCHAALDQASGCLAIANYSSGSVAFHRTDPVTGVPGEGVIFAHSGKGPDTSRQEGPHAHWVGFSPDRRWLHSVDLGNDSIIAYRFDAQQRTLVAATSPAWRAPPGAGPRHLVWHPRLPRAYVVCEMANMLVALDSRSDGSFISTHQASTLPTGFTGASQAAHRDRSCGPLSLCVEPGP